MAPEKVNHQDMMLSLKQAGYTDGAIALEIAALLSYWAQPPSLNSVRRWRYGTSNPSPYYAALLEKLYTDAISRGIISSGEPNDK